MAFLEEKKIPTNNVLRNERLKTAEQILSYIHAREKCLFQSKTF